MAYLILTYLQTHSKILEIVKWRCTSKKCVAWAISKVHQNSYKKWNKNVLLENVQMSVDTININMYGENT